MGIIVERETGEMLMLQRCRKRALFSGGGYRACKGQGFFFRALNFGNISPGKVLLLPLGSKRYAGAPWDSTWHLENLTLACMLTAQKGASKENRGKQTKEREGRKATGFGGFLEADSGLLSLGKRQLRKCK